MCVRFQLREPRQARIRSSPIFSPLNWVWVYLPKGKKNTWIARGTLQAFLNADFGSVSLCREIEWDRASYERFMPEATRLTRSKQLAIITTFNRKESFKRKRDTGAYRKTWHSFDIRTRASAANKIDEMILRASSPSGAYMCVDAYTRVQRQLFWCVRTCVHSPSRRLTELTCKHASFVSRAILTRFFFVKNTSDPRPQSSFTTSRCPCWQAKCRQVLPPCMLWCALVILFLYPFRAWHFTTSVAYMQKRCVIECMYAVYTSHLHTMPECLHASCTNACADTCDRKKMSKYEHIHSQAGPWQVHKTKKKE